MPTLTITSSHQVDELVRAVRLAAEKTVRAMRLLLANEDDALQALRMMQFSEMGHHPSESRGFNLLEQVSQTFHSLTTLEAARFVLHQHPELSGVKVNLGSAAGFGVQGVEEGVVVAQTLTATDVHSHGKLCKDALRMLQKAPQFKHRYVFFSCPGFGAGRQTQLETVPGIEIWSLPADQLLKVPA